MVNSVKKATDILQLLSDNPGECMSLGKISELCGINKSTCAHIMDTLCESLFVERVSRKQGYRLGPWAYMLSRKGRYQDELIKISEPILVWLQNQLGATVYLDIVCNGVKYVLYYLDRDHLLLNSGDAIIQGRMETTASGLIHMAYMDRDEIARTLAKSEESGNAGKAVDSVLPAADSALNQKLSLIRKNNYAHISNYERAEQAFAFSVTNCSHHAAAVGIVYQNRIDSKEYRDKVIKAGKQAAAEISHRLSFR